MPQFNTSLDRFYKTTAHWDPWKQYRELINDENINSVKFHLSNAAFIFSILNINAAFIAKLLFLIQNKNN